MFRLFFVFLLFFYTLQASADLSYKGIFKPTYKLTKNQVLRTFKSQNISNEYLIANAHHISKPELLQLILKMESYSEYKFTEDVYKILINKDLDFIINNFNKNNFATEALLHILSQPRSEYWLRGSDISAVTLIKNEFQRDVLIHFVNLFSRMPQKLIDAYSEVHNVRSHAWNGYFVSAEVFSALKHESFNEYSLPLVKLYFKDFPTKRNIQEIRKRLDIISEIDLLNIRNKWQFLMALRILDPKTFVSLNRITIKEDFKATVFMANLNKIQDKQSYQKFRSFLDSVLSTKKFNLSDLVDL